MTPIGAQAPIGTASQVAFSFNDLTSVRSLGHNIGLFARRVQQRLRSFPNRTLRYWEVRRASGGKIAAGSGSLASVLFAWLAAKSGCRLRPSLRRWILGADLQKPVRVDELNEFLRTLAAELATCLTRSLLSRNSHADDQSIGSQSACFGARQEQE